jgi:hypothetical protein
MSNTTKENGLNEKKYFFSFLISANNVLFIMTAVVLSIYISTLSPSIAGGDSGEIVAEGCQVIIIIFNNKI